MNSAAMVQMRLPATSANLGSAFDVAAVALDIHLEVTAQPAEQFSIHAIGRDAAACSRPESNLILATYRRALNEAGIPAAPVALRVHNQIPLGMGCGSSAAARLAGLILAQSLGGLSLSSQQLLAHAAALEGHPDNVAACWHGGLAVSAVGRAGEQAAGLLPIATARVPVPREWCAALLLPRHPVLTEASRVVLPQSYERAHVVDGLQRCGLMVAAFASGDGQLLRDAMDDRLHQPYRRGLCPLLDHADALSRVPGVLGVALSGAGPALLLVLDNPARRARLEAHVPQILDAAAIEMMFCDFDRRGTQVHGGGPAKETAPSEQSAVLDR